MDWSKSPLTLEDYHAAWQAAIARSREMTDKCTEEPSIENIAAGRDAIADEEYQRELYFRMLAEQEGEI
jgi:hypothetical protein